MIDTDKYEGHTEGPWSEANANLIADAPKLLAFYKRIKEIMDMDEIEEIERVELILQEMSE